MRRWYILLYWMALALLLAGCRQSGCEQGGDAKQPPAKTLLQGATDPAAWRGLQPGSSLLGQVNDTLSAMPDIQTSSIYHDRYTLSQGSFSQEVVKIYFNFAPGNNQQNYERVLLSQVAAGDYLDPQVAAGRMDELSQRMQAWQGLQPATPYTPQPCPSK